MCLLYWGAYGPFRGLVLVLLRYLLALPTRMYFIQLQTPNHPLSIIRQSRHSVFAQVKSLNIQSSRSLFKWSEVSIQRSLQRVNSSPGKKTSNWPLWESMFSSPVCDKTDTEVDEGRATLGVLVGNDLRPPCSPCSPCSCSSQRLIAVQFPHFKSAGGADSLSPSKGTFFSQRQMKVTFVAFDY